MPVVNVNDTPGHDVTPYQVWKKKIQMIVQSKFFFYINDW